MSECNWPTCGCQNLWGAPWCKGTVRLSTTLTVAQPSPALAALAMREQAADKLSEIIDGWEVIRKYHKPGSFSGDAAIKSIRDLPTTFTDAELLAAAWQLPEVRALIEAAKSYREGLEQAITYRYYEGESTMDDYSDEDAALALFTRKVE